MDFWLRFFDKHDETAIDDYLSDPYIQHNPTVKDGVKAFYDEFHESTSRNGIPPVGGRRDGYARPVIRSLRRLKSIHSPKERKETDCVKFFAGGVDKRRVLCYNEAVTQRKRKEFDR
mgnify:CR=1 FL=1